MYAFPVGSSHSCWQAMGSFRNAICETAIWVRLTFESNWSQHVKESVLGRNIEGYVLLGNLEEVILATERFNFICLSFHLLLRLLTSACQLVKTLNCDTMEVGNLIRKTLSLYLWSISKCFQSLLMSIWSSVILVLAVFLVFESVDYQKQRGGEA